MFVCLFVWGVWGLQEPSTLNYALIPNAKAEPELPDTSNFGVVSYRVVVGRRRSTRRAWQGAAEEFGCLGQLVL